MEEYIARERVIEEIKGMDNCGCITRSVNHVCEDIRSIPPADVIPIPEGATNGDMIKTMFPNAEYGKDILGNIFVISSVQLGHIAFRESWWNAPYKERMND